MARHLKDHRSGFPDGLTAITRPGEPEDDTGLGLEVLRLRAGEKYEETPKEETAWLLMSGTVKISAGDREATFHRSSLFDELPSCIHAPAGTAMRVAAEKDAELTVYRTANEKTFPVEVYAPADVRNERRGEGALRDTSFRFVRTIFDDTNAHESSMLVLGEVLNLPGRWSSYPPHHHPQPEIYHYRFTHPEGYGHAELGEQVLRVKSGDTVKIFGGNDHSQCAAPGYGMYYAWVIRHLPNERYTVPEFTEAHRFLMNPAAQTWWPSDA